MKSGVLLLLTAGLAVAAPPLRAQFVWTGGSADNGSITLLENWEANNIGAPKGIGTETLTFGNVAADAHTMVRVPTAAFLDIAFTGDARPAYIFTGEGSNPIVLFNGSLTASPGNAIIVSNTLQLSLSPGAHTIATEAIFSVIARIFEASGVASLIKTGGGALHLSGNSGTSTFSGGVVVEEGALVLSGSSVIENGFVTGGQVGTGTLTLNDATALYAFPGEVNLHNPVALPGGTVSLDSVSDADALHLKGTVSGNGGLEVNGAGTFTLSGNNTYAGGTTVNNGTLAASINDSSLGSGPIVVQSGGTLHLDGTFLSNQVVFNPGSRLTGSGGITTTTIGAGVRMSPGEFGPQSIGTFTFQDLTLSGGGNYDWSLKDATSTPGTGWDVVHVTAPTTLTISANASNPFNLKLYSLQSDRVGGAPAGFDPDESASWLIFGTNGIEVTGGSSLADSFAIDASNFVGVTSDLFSLTRVNNDLFLTFTPVPEPSTYALMALGLTALGVRTWRRRQRRAGGVVHQKK